MHVIISVLGLIFAGGMGFGSYKLAMEEHSGFAFLFGFGALCVAWWAIVS